MNRGAVVTLLALALQGFAVTTTAEALRLAGERQVILINLSGGLPGRWTSCVEVCPEDLDQTSQAEVQTLLRPAPGGGRISWLLPGDPAATRELERLEYEVRLYRDEQHSTAVLTAKVPFRGMRLVHSYTIGTHDRMLSASLQVPPGARLQLTGGQDLAPERLPGFASLYSDARGIMVSALGQRTLTEDGGTASIGVPLAAAEWAGVRGRFWTLLLKSASALLLDAGESVPDQPQLTFRRDVALGGILDLTFYGGPVAQGDLVANAPELGGMLYAGLWQPLRYLSFGLHWLLDRWQELVGNWGVAIVLLSLSVKILMAPLIFFAEGWQADVNRTQSLLQPELAAIKRDFKGEDAHNRTLAVYRKHRVSQFYAVKSLAGFLIQIPVFIAAFDMLGENFGLNGAGFLWVHDLAVPDRVAALPVMVPFFGGHLNLLPVLMTTLTVLAARLQEEPSLSPGLRQGQRLRLYGMAGVFFILLYTFPAGMVLYWTANNFWHLTRILTGRFARST